MNPITSPFVGIQSLPKNSSSSIPWAAITYAPAAHAKASISSSTRLTSVIPRNIFLSFPPGRQSNGSSPGGKKSCSFGIRSLGCALIAKAVTNSDVTTGRRATKAQSVLAVGSPSEVTRCVHLSDHLSVKEAAEAPTYSPISQRSDLTAPTPKHNVRGTRLTRIMEVFPNRTVEIAQEPGRTTMLSVPLNRLSLPDIYPSAMFSSDIHSSLALFSALSSGPRFRYVPADDLRSSTTTEKFPSSGEL
mmetsp:Transcript_50832/g.99408  ORF Transcript_50832/g.99408 Transcript_50832/m.99408 type:complete len:246 (-) Transcript_50832:105-842(-)